MLHASYQLRFNAINPVKNAPFCSNYEKTLVESAVAPISNYNTKDLSWRLEPYGRNLKTWIGGGEYGEQKGPPDPSLAADAKRNSALPSDTIVTALGENKNTKGKVKAFENTDNKDAAGAFLCEFMAFNIPWYQEKRQKLPASERMQMGGFTHVGYGVSAKVATEAVQVQLGVVVSKLKAR